MNMIQLNAYAMKKKENKGCCRIQPCRFLELDVGCVDVFEVFMKIVLFVSEVQSEFFYLFPLRDENCIHDSPDPKDNAPK